MTEQNETSTPCKPLMENKDNFVWNKEMVLVGKKIEKDFNYYLYMPLPYY